MRDLAGRSAVLDAVRAHPYARFATAMATGITGVTTGGAVLWWGDGPLGRLTHGLGDPETLQAMLAEVTGDGRLTGLARVNLPRPAAVPPGYRLYEDWDFRWSQAPPPPQEGQDRVRLIDDPEAIDRLLDAAYPDSMLRPGHPMAHDWYGIHGDGGELVACAADRSARLAEPSVGVLGGIAVHPDHRRSGWGAAVTAGLTGILRSRYDLVGLGVVPGNVAAGRLYERLGFTGIHGLTAIRPV